jgi:hypothetical protein
MFVKLKKGVQREVERRKYVESRLLTFKPPQAQTERINSRGRGYNFAPDWRLKYPNKED